MAGFEPRYEYQKRQKQPYQPNDNMLGLKPVVEALSAKPFSGQPGVYQRQTLPTAGQPLGTATPNIPALQKAQAAQTPNPPPLATQQPFGVFAEQPPADVVAAADKARGQPWNQNPWTPPPLASQPKPPPGPPVPGAVFNVQSEPNGVSWQEGETGKGWISSTENPGGIARVEKGLRERQAQAVAMATNPPHLGGEEALTGQVATVAQAAPSAPPGLQAMGWDDRANMAKYNAEQARIAAEQRAAEEAYRNSPEYLAQVSDRLAQQQFDRVRGAAESIARPATPLDWGTWRTPQNQKARTAMALELMQGAAPAGTGGVTAGGGLGQQAIQGRAQENVAGIQRGTELAKQEAEKVAAAAQAQNAFALKQYEKDREAALKEDEDKRKLENDLILEQAKATYKPAEYGVAMQWDASGQGQTPYTWNKQTGLPPGGIPQLGGQLAQGAQGQQTTQNLQPVPVHQRQQVQQMIAQHGEAWTRTQLAKQGFTL